MRNNTSFSKITVDSASRKSSLFNFSHDVNTSCGIGDLQPLQCKLLVPDSKTSCSIKTLVRLAPMNVPTFTRLKLKSWSSFIGFSDLSRRVGSFLSKSPQYAGTGHLPRIKESLPSLPLSFISTFVLVGSQVSIYKNTTQSSPDDSAEFNAYTLYDSTDSSNVNAVMSDVGLNTIFTSSALDNAFPSINSVNTCHALSIGAILKGVRPNKKCSWLQKADQSYIGDSALVSHFSIPVANVSANSFFGTQVTSPIASSATWSPVPLTSADYVLVGKFNNNTYAFAFRLSAFGKRLRKVLLGLGYQIDFYNDSRVNILPLCAYNKACFDTFGLCLYDSWETTATAHVMSYYDSIDRAFAPLYSQQGSYTVDIVCHESSVTSTGGTFPCFWPAFFYDLGNQFVTEDTDFISAHTRTDAVSVAGNKFTYPVTKPIAGAGTDSYGNPTDIQSYDESAESNTARLSSGHSYIMNLNHTEVDSELLKRLYKWTNRNTIAGRRIAELLRAQGLGKYVDEQKSNFIGYEELNIDVIDINATADSTNTVNGKNSMLGEYVGKGIGSNCGRDDNGNYKQPKSFTFENNEFGYWITLSAICSDSGYVDGVDQTLFDLEKEQLYNPDFDALGMELTRKSVIATSGEFTNENDVNSDSASFGLVPVYSRYKVGKNILNGDFSLRSRKSALLPYTLDKVLSFGDRYVVDSGNGVFSTVKQLKSLNVPIAGNVWRFLNRYPWLTHFDRIFAVTNDNYDHWYDLINNSALLAQYEYYFSSEDNFYLQNVVNMRSWAKMLPISDSYGTTDENDGKGDMTIDKA